MATRKQREAAKKNATNTVEKSSSPDADNEPGAGELDDENNEDEDDGEDQSEDEEDADGEDEEADGAEEWEEDAPSLKTPPVASKQAENGNNKAAPKAEIAEGDPSLLLDRQSVAARGNRRANTSEGPKVAKLVASIRFGMHMPVELGGHLRWFNKGSTFLTRKEADYLSEQEYVGENGADVVWLKRQK